MWKKHLGLGTSSDFDLPVEEQIRLFARVGFDAFFTGWEPGAPVAAWAAVGKECGMIYQSIHAPFGGAATLWREDESAAQAVLSELFACLRDCADNSVPIMVCHVYIGFGDDKPPCGEPGLSRYGRLIAEAKRLGVKIAFENTEGEEYLDLLLRTFSDEPTVCFCWDSGHEMCYNHSRDLLAEFGGQLIATHLNDNLGISDFGGKATWTDDLHLLPFDGIADWRYNTDRLRRCGYDGILTFELLRRSKPERHENDAYFRLDPEEYVTVCYMRACRVAALLERAGQ